MITGGQIGQAAGHQPFPAQIIQPDRDPGLAQGPQCVVHRDSPSRLMAANDQLRTPARAKNSALAGHRCCSVPVKAEVTVVEPSARTPRTRHARVLGLQHHARAAGVQPRGQAVGDLLGQPFLGLRPGREVLHEAGQLGQARGCARQAGSRRARPRRRAADGARRPSGTGWRAPAPVRRSPRRWGTWSAAAAGHRTVPRRRAPSGPVFPAIRPGQHQSPGRPGSPRRPAAPPPGRRPPARPAIRRSGRDGSTVPGACRASRPRHLRGFGGQFLGHDSSSALAAPPDGAPPPIATQQCPG